MDLSVFIADVNINLAHLRDTCNSSGIVNSTFTKIQNPPPIPQNVGDDGVLLEANHLSLANWCYFSDTWMKLLV